MFIYNGSFYVINSCSKLLANMNFPRYLWNKNIKNDFFEFLKTSEQYKTNEFCNKEEYDQLKAFFPLSNGIKQEFSVYMETSNVLIDITQSDDETQKSELVSSTHNQLEVVDNAHTTLTSENIVSHDENIAKGFLDAVRDSLDLEKIVSKTLLEDLLNLDNANLKQCFSYFAKELVVGEVQKLWDSLSSSNIMNDTVVEYFIHLLLLPKVKEEFSYEINEVFAELHQKYGAILKTELVTEFVQSNQHDNSAPNVLLHYITSFSNDYKTQILRDFISSAGKLHPTYLSITEALLNPQVDAETLVKIVEMMANEAAEFCSDNTYGKLLFKTITSLDRNVTGLEQPLKRILGTHKGIWKIKVEKIIFSWFNDSLTQSFM